MAARTPSATSANVSGVDMALGSDVVDQPTVEWVVLHHRHSVVL
jgi:hypothetical protein